MECLKAHLFLKKNFFKKFNGIKCNEFIFTEFFIQTKHSVSCHGPTVDSDTDGGRDWDFFPKKII